VKIKGVAWLITVENGAKFTISVFLCERVTQISGAFIVRSVKGRFLIYFCFYTTQISFIKIFLFFALLLPNSPKICPSVEKILEGHLPSVLASPKLRLW
jgi:hypothetical protein